MRATATTATTVPDATAVLKIPHCLLPSANALAIYQMYADSVVPLYLGHLTLHMRVIWCWASQNYSGVHCSAGTVLSTSWRRQDTAVRVQFFPPSLQRRGHF